MSALDTKGAGRLFSRLILAAGSAAFLAACTSDTSRFAESFSGADPVVTNTAQTPSNEPIPPEGIAGAGGSMASPQFSAAPSASPAITSAPLAPLRGTTSPNPSFDAPATPSPRLAAPAVAAAAAPTVTGTTRNLARSGNWKPTGGSPITVGQGETAQMLSNRYGVPVSTLLAVNGMKSASDLKPGTRLTIPVYDASGKLAGGTTGSIAPAAAGVAGAAALAGAAAVTTRNTAKPAARPKLAAAEPAQAAEQARETKAKAAKEAKEAAAKAAREKEEKVKQAKLAETKRREAEQARLAKLKEKPKAASNTQTADSEPAQEAPKPGRQQQAARTAAPADETPTGSVDPEARAKPAGAKPEFRWPARGRVIQSYRKGSNDGINIAVPEGTPVKAAEAGTVAYAGSELKGYGNLVLIRHPNGFVSAYAHNGELNVKRGDTVRRGQTIARSGRTGNVSSPQLHFELRKGSTPVDPSEYLAGN